MVRILLLLVSLVVFLGCPGVGAPMAPTPQEEEKDPDPNEAAGRAAALAKEWGQERGAVELVNGTTLRLKKDLIVTEAPPGQQGMMNTGRAVITVEGDKYYVSGREIPAGVTVEVPVGKSLQAGKAAEAITISIAGKLEVKKGATDPSADGKLIVGSAAALTVTGSEAKITVGGTLRGAGAITVEGGALEVSAGASIDSGASLTLTVKNEGKVTVAKELTSSGMSGVSIIVEPGGAIEASGDVVKHRVTNSGGNISVPDAEVGGSFPATGAYTIQYYNAAKKQVQLNNPSTDESTWHSTADNSAADALFNAIYSPNAPGSTDTFHPGETGKMAIPYTADISKKVLALFKVTFNGSGVEKVEITGEPPAKNIVTPNAASDKLIIIDLGLPGTEVNVLPKFSIPLNTNGRGTLGLDTTTTETAETLAQDYSHIRLRVNNGADLTILADNSSGTSASCPVGGFGGGCVEVMAGGKLRDGAYQGFPLGANAVLLNWTGSYLSVGPDNNTDQSSWWYGYLIGPDSTGADKPRIKWDESNTTGYIEVRPSKLAISGDVTVQKTLGLIYSAWFIGNTQVTIDTGSDTATLFGQKGLFANETGATNLYNFYGTAEARIVVKAGSVLHKAFLTGEVADNGKFLTIESGSVTITGSTGGTAGYYPPGTDLIPGYLNWNTGTAMEIP
jgi:hypothetical protein